MPSAVRLYKILGETIRAARIKSGLSQEELAEKADLTRNYIGQTERAEKRITLEALAKIAHALGVSVSHLTSGLK